MSGGETPSDRAARDEVVARRGSPSTFDDLEAQPERVH
jgi:hypothetical protein